MDATLILWISLSKHKILLNSQQISEHRANRALSFIFEHLSHIFCRHQLSFNVSFRVPVSWGKLGQIRQHSA